MGFRHAPRLLSAGRTLLPKPAGAGKARLYSSRLLTLIQPPLCSPLLLLCSGLVVSDCGAIDSIVNSHEWAPTRARAAAAALRAGTDLACLDYSALR